MKEHKKKERLDVLLVKRGFAESREKAKAIIMTGNVFVKEQREDKAGSTFDENVEIEVKGTPMKYVSRGGYKLEKAMELWQVPLADRVCMDVGSSTGGFTDCMLQNGAVKVYAIDVGTNQLAWKLRQDERVVSMEKTNIRYVTHEDVPDNIGFSSIDVAFISLTKVLVPVRNLLADNGRVVCLIKPQFEAGKDKVGKKGVVRDKKVQQTSCTWLPITTWNWPPLSTTIITPGFFFSPSASAFWLSFSLKRSRVAQWTRLTMFSFPPTWPRISVAKAWYSISISLHPMPAGTC